MRRKLLNDPVRPGEEKRDDADAPDNHENRVRDFHFVRFQVFVNLQPADKNNDDQRQNANHLNER